jgi:hypothetical protein
MYSGSSDAYWKETLAASIAIIPVFYGFVVKSDRQLGRVVSTVTYKQCLFGGFKAAPLMGCVAVTDLLMQDLLERRRGIQEKEAKWHHMLMTSTAISICALPFNAIFNGYTIQRTAVQSLRMLSWKQGGALTCRDALYLFSLRLSTPISEALSDKWGVHPLINYGASFCAGAIGGALSHPADSALTLWQKGLNVKSLGQTFRGTQAKMLAAGSFALGYRAIRDFLDQKTS